ncbi:MAG: hypothetical protein Q8Q62_08165 [Mesorhizobium sp.]|nr:hypothetical protein [Mesorhizobium sp.]
MTLPAEKAAISRSMVFYGTPPEVIATAPAQPAASPGDDAIVPDVALAYPAPLDPALRPAPPAPYTMLSPSIIALGEPAQPVEDMNVAAIGNSPPALRRSEPAPMVIRGGIAGDAFARETPPQAGPANEAPTPAPEQVSARPTKDNPGPRMPDPQPTPAPPPPAPAAPAAQTRLPE